MNILQFTFFLVISLCNISTLQLNQPDLRKFTDILQNANLGGGSNDLYGFPQGVLYTHKFIQNRSNFITVWPEKDFLKARENQHVITEVGQNVLNELVTKQLVHFITDKLAGYALPVESISTPKLNFDKEKWFGRKMGSLEIVLTNIRIHRVRIDKFISPDPENIKIKHDYFGGKLKDSRRSRSLEKPLAKLLHDQRQKINRDYSKASQMKRVSRRQDPSKNGKSENFGDDVDEDPDYVEENQSEAGEFFLNDHNNLQNAQTRKKPILKMMRNGYEKTGNERFRGRDETYKSYRNSSDETRQFLFFGEKTMHISIKGLNVVMTTDYEIRGVDGWLKNYRVKGKLYTRMINSVLTFDLTPSRCNRHGIPSMIVPKLPEIYLGEISTVYKDTIHKKLFTKMTKEVLRRFRDMFPILFANTIQDLLPRLTEMAFDLVDTHMLNFLNQILNQVDIKPDIWPRIAFEDFSWFMEDYRLKIGLKVRHIVAAERHYMYEHMKLWKFLHPDAPDKVRLKAKKKIVNVKVRHDNDHNPGILAEPEENVDVAEPDTLEKYKMLLDEISNPNSELFRPYKEPKHNGRYGRGRATMAIKEVKATKTPKQSTWWEYIMGK